jgi:TorA maturation chaperone TorD
MTTAPVAMATRAELFRALGALAEPPAAGHASIAAALGLGPLPSPADHADLFLFAAYPYASVYLGVEGMLGGEARDRVAGFWRALGLTPPPEPDHLATMLGLYGALVEADARARDGDAAPALLRRESRRAFLWEHLLSWLPVWLDKVETIAPAAYVPWARLLREALVGEAVELGPPATLPLALRVAPGLPDDAEDAATWTAALLAPVRSGLLLTRPDLRRAALDLDLGMRAGERAFMLRALLEQDAERTAGWLADEAGRARDRYGEMETTLEPVVGFWRQRAEACQAALARARPGSRRVVRDGG